MELQGRGEVGVQSVRMGDWKAYRKGGWKGDLELYDLGKDIGEKTILQGNIQTSSSAWKRS